MFALRTSRPTRPGRQLSVRAVNEASVRPVALPGALWLLDGEAAGYYSVRGSSFVIQRAESHDEGSIRKKQAKKRDGKTPSVRQPTANDYLGGMWARPELMLTAAGSDVMDVEVECVPQRPTTSLVWVPQQPATGMVRWPLVEEDQQEAVAEAMALDGEGAEDQVYTADTKSPRRTKMLRFKCCAKDCGTVNLRPINPHAFHEGTAFAECGKCGVWHLIKDNLNLFNQLKGPVFVDRRSALQEEDLPPSLRLRADDEDTKGRNDGSVRWSDRDLQDDDGSVQWL